MSSVLREDYNCILLDEDEDEDEDGMFSDVCTNDGNKLWENGTVPFVFDKNLTRKLQDSLKEAMRRIERASPRIKFVPKTDQTDFIEFVDEGTFSSYVGRIDGKQVRALLIFIFCQ